MGDVADMILEGILCEFCGELIDETATGAPRSCDDCASIAVTLKEWCCELCGIVSAPLFCEACDGTMLAAFLRLRWKLNAAGRAILDAMRFR